MKTLEPFNQFFADSAKYGADARCLVVCVHPQTARYKFDELRDLATVRIVNTTTRYITYRSGATMVFEVVYSPENTTRLLGREYTHLVLNINVPTACGDKLRTLLRSKVIPNCHKNIAYF